MNEIDQSQAMIELELLQRTVPSWKLANTEPFIRSAQQDVTPPDWDKRGFLDTNGSSVGQSVSATGSVSFLAGVQQTDGSFAIQLVTASGFAGDPPT